MIFIANQQIVAEYYIASLGRAPEKTGLDYWVSRLESVVDGQPQLSSDEIRDFFLDRSISEVSARFPVGQSSLSLVENIYKNVFGRDGDSGGLEYWAARLDGTIEGQSQLNDNELISTMLTIAKDPVNEVDGIFLADQLKAAYVDYTTHVNISLDVDNSFSNINLATSLLSSSSTYGVATLDSDKHWDENLEVITFSFNKSVPNDYYFSYSTNELFDGWKPLSSEHQDIVLNY